MSKKLNQLNIKGQCFKDEQNLVPQEDGVAILSKNINLLYGRNGSGKSTIAKAIRLFAAGRAEDEGFTVDFNGSISEEAQKNIYVFDEHFIDENVRINKSGLDTIVMLGAQVEYDAKIREVTNKQTQTRKELEDLNEKKSKQDSAQNASSHLFYEARIRKTLKERYADRDRRIRANKTNTAIKDDFVHDIIASDIDSEDDLVELSNQLEQKIADIESSKDAQLVGITIKDIPSPINVDELSALLGKVIVKPNLDEYGKKIEAILQSGESKDKTQELLSDQDKKYCPLCLQEIRPDHRETVLMVISQLYEDEARAYEQELQSYIDKINNFSSSLWQEEKISQLREKGIIGNIADYKLNYKSLMQELYNIKKAIVAKKQNVYKPAENIDVDLFPRLLSRCNECLESFRNSLNEYNSSISERAQRIADAKALNKKVACLENKADSMRYNELKQSYDQLVNKIRELTERDEALEKEKEDLKHKMQNVKIALDLINEYLSYIFISHDRMKLEASNGSYKLIVNNQNVNVNMASIGERNILALVYFFVRIFQNQALQHRYSAERLLVIDDPISSFDFNNKIGILSFIEYQIVEFCKGNANSKILLMSHDRQTISYLANAYYKSKEKQKKVNVLSLKDNKLYKIEKQFTSEYGVLLNDVFQYIVTPNSEQKDDRFSIGNKMRKILESLSTFLYKCGVDEMMKNEDLINMLPEELRYYYQYRLFGLLYHAGSHKENQVKALLLDEDAFNPAEQKKLAKMLFVFLYHTQRAHLCAFLDDAKIDTIKKWNQDLKQEGEPVQEEGVPESSSEMKE